MSAELWGVWCVVSGGITGHRESWLKANDARCEWPSKQEAEREATRCLDSLGMIRTASFHYYAKRIT